MSDGPRFQMGEPLPPGLERHLAGLPANEGTWKPRFTYAGVPLPEHLKPVVEKTIIHRETQRALARQQFLEAVEEEKQAMIQAMREAGTPPETQAEVLDGFQQTINNALREIDARRPGE